MGDGVVKGFTCGINTSKGYTYGGFLFLLFLHRYNACSPFLNDLYTSVDLYAACCSIYQSFYTVHETKMAFFFSLFVCFWKGEIKKIFKWKLIGYDFSLYKLVSALYI